MTPLADRLMEHAARVMPPSRRDWIRGMRAELAHIPAADAVIFALGCVRASYAQRALDVITLVRLARWALAACAFLGAASYLVATALLGFVKAAPRLTPQDLGSDPGTAETLRFVQGYPAWQLANFGLVAVLLVVGALLLLRRSRSALLTLMSAVGAATLLAVLDRGLSGTADWPLAWSVGWLIPLACLPPVWWLTRRAPDLQTTA